MQELQKVTGRRSEAEGVHFGFFVRVVLAGIAQAIVEAAALFCKSPDEAFAGRKRFRLALENGIVESAPGIDPLPAFVRKFADYILEVKSVDHAVVEEQGVRDFVAQNVERELAIEGGAVE